MRGTAATATEHGASSASATPHGISAVTATEHDQTGRVTENHNFTASFLCGCGALKCRAGKLIMTTLATAMQAANVADFYMTKYLSKAQETLGPVMQPFIAGMRRIATAG